MDKHPLSVCWNITSDCNLECPFCFRDKNSQAMPTRHWDMVLTKLSAAGVRRLALAGGEPFIVPEIALLLAKARECGLMTSVITNGMLVDRAAIRNVALSLDEMAISIDGATPESHAIIRHTSESDFHHLLDNLDALRSTSIRRRVNSVVTAQSTACLDNLGELLCALDVHEWRLMQFFPLHDAASIAQKFELADGVFQQVVRRIQRRYDGAPIHISVGSNESMARSYLNIAPDGAVYTSAPGTLFSLGNILEDSIENAVGGHALDWLNHTKQYAIVERLASRETDQLLT